MHSFFGMTGQEWAANATAITILAVVLGMLWKGVAWIGPNFLMPIKDKMISHLGKIEDVQVSLVDVMQRQERALENQNSALRELRESSVATATMLRDQSGQLHRINSSLDQIRETSGQYFDDEHQRAVNGAQRDDRRD